ncbi:MAG: hypothetical protein KDD82_12285 [Planctomycetes bacterium]|nr:hypothetical protein [Planctomycetota bacterium]
MSRPRRHPATFARIACLGLGLAWAGAPALAQERLEPVDPPPAEEEPSGRFDAPPPVEDGAPPPVRDLEGWLGEGDGAQADPLAPDAGPAPAEPELTREEQRKRSRAIDHNYDKALEIYDDLSLPHHEVEALDRRIANNERLIKDYGARIARAREERRTLQVELMNRGFYLRQQREQGQITQQVFEQQMAHEERVSESRDKALKGDLASWTREVQAAETRLQDLKNQRQMLARTLPRGRTTKAEAPKPRPGQRLMTTLETRLQKLGRFRVRHTLDFADPRSTAFSGMPRPQAPAAVDSLAEGEE